MKFVAEVMLPFIAIVSGAYALLGGLLYVVTEGDINWFGWLKKLRRPIKGKTPVWLIEYDLAPEELAELYTHNQLWHMRNAVEEADRKNPGFYTPERRIANNMATAMSIISLREAAKKAKE